MFGFLKEKLKSALSAFSKKAEEEAPEEEIEVEEKESTAPKPRAATPKAPPKPAPKPKAAPTTKKEPPKPSPSPKKTVAPQKPAPSPKKEAPQPAKPEKKETKSQTPSAPKPAPEPPKQAPEPPKKPGFFARIFGKKETAPEEKAEIPAAPPEKETSEEPVLETPAATEEPAASTPELPEGEIEPAEPAEEEGAAEGIEEAVQPEELAEAQEQGEAEEGEALEEAIPEEEQEPESIEERASAIEEPAAEEPIVEEEATGFFARLTQKIVTKKITSAQFEDLFFDLELALLENNVAMEVIEKIKADLAGQIVDKPIRRGKVEEAILSALKQSIQGLFIKKPVDLLALAKSKKPLIICLVGINGSGKTTTIAKLAQFFQDNDLEPVIAAADTFRAAAIDQLEEHGTRLGVKVIKHEYGSDAAAVAYDAIKHADSKGKDVVLIDTAGRMQSNVNLMDEMKKIIRVSKPDIKIFIGESIAGNDCIEQAKAFNDAIGIDGIILSKADVDEKGGAAISVSYVTGKPILYLGMGQEYKDLKPFSPALILEQLGL